MNAHKLMRQINSKQPTAIRQETGRQEAGQSIVLIALALVAIIGFMGIALDVGFVFARGSQLQAAIDAAALAGVTELSGWAPNNNGNGDIEAGALTKSAQFLNANGMPISVTLSLDDPGNLYVDQTPLGATQYAITATWPVETFFLKVLGFAEPINLSRSATAAVFSLANVYASRRIEDGIISTSSQGMFGPDICTSYGDPYSPLNSVWAPGSYTWKYRIMIPPDYEQATGTSILRVELLDPDSINAPTPGTVTIPRTLAAQGAGLSETTTGTCPSGNPSNQKNPCLIPTGELPLAQNGTLPLDRINPWWFIRLDENRGTGTSGQCGEPGSYNATRNTQTFFELYYLRQNPDGTIIRQDLANYTGQVGDGNRDNGGHLTDMQWVSPGAVQSYDYPGNRNTGVPADPGSPGNFEIDLANETTNILVEQGSGLRYINLDITNISGASENGFEIWAGPPTYIETVPGQANPRNLAALNNPGSHSSKGATVFGSGTLPMNSDFDDPVDIPLIYVGPEMAGQEISVSLFDTDSGAAPPIVFFFDSISQDDWSFTFAQSGVPDPDGSTRNCVPGGCDNRWVTPAYRITVPGGDLEDCDYGNPQGDPDCVPFYGGRLVANYNGGVNDSYSWQITIPGLPYLVR